MRSIERQHDFTNQDLQEIFRQSEAADIITIPQIADEFMARVNNDPTVTGMALPWIDLHDKVRLRLGEISVWAGINGHKKSTVISQIAVHIANDSPVGIASFEMKLEETAYMMCKQAGATDRPTDEFATDFMSWANEKIWLYRALGGVKPLEVLGAIRAFADVGCKLIVIDNLQFCGVTEDIEKERLFVNQLVGISEALKVHIAVIHHVRKPQTGGDEYVPTRFDVRGGGTITDQAHYVFICWHNKLKAEYEKARDRGISLDGPKWEKIAKQPNFRLIVAKQRHAPFEGSIGLYEGKGQTFKRGDIGESIRVKIPRTGGYGE